MSTTGTIDTTPDVRTPNHQLFVDVLAQIEKHPETWDQRAFPSRGGPPCGTSFCFAGHAVARSGEEWQFDAGRRAAELLGIEWRTPRVDGAVEWMLGNPLFDANNTLDDLYRISAELLGLDEQVLRDKVRDAVADGATQGAS